MSVFDSGRFGQHPPHQSDLTLPTACPSCRSSSITTTAKNPDATSYWRCGSCGEIWNVSRRDVTTRNSARPWR